MTPRTTACLAAILLLSLGTAAPGAAQQAQSLASQSLQQRVETIFRDAGPGPRFGLVVATEDGTELIAIRPDERFLPASNVKMFTTAAAFDMLPGIDQPDVAGGASVRLDEAGDAILTGHGDARMSSAPDCIANCLAGLAEAVAAKTRVVRNVVGDDSLFPDQRWSPGMSWEDIPTRSGTAISALTLDDNVLALRVTPAAPGKPPVLDALPYFTIENRAVTGAATALTVDRLPGSMDVRLTGTIAADAETVLLRLGIDDPAHYAAWRFKTALEARGVRVTGQVTTRHRAAMPADDPAVRGSAPPMRPPLQPELARLTPPPLGENLVLTNKVSQNLHADLLLRRVGRVTGTGSIADGLAAINAMLQRAGVTRASFDFADGSGMSLYNRLAPRGVVKFLQWTTTQPWAAQWRATLPIGGVDGTLTRRFAGTPLERRLFAKTGTLSGTNALSGFMTARSGRTLLFSIYANDVPEGRSASATLDGALMLVAQEN